MKASEFVGIIPPIMSSFKKNGEIYQKGLREIVNFTIPHVNAYYPIGTYGCGPLMSLSERKKTLEIILDEVNGRVPVIAHVGAAGTLPTIELAKHAKEAGADAIGAIAPYYSPGLPEDALFAHFAALIDAVNKEDFPVFLYNNHKYSQNPLSPKLLKRLADYGLRGCKDSSFDLVNFFLYQEAVKDYPDFNIIIGTEAIFMGAFEAGAKATVCGIGNIYPELLQKMYQSFIAGNKEEAMELQRLILKIRNITKYGPTVPIMYEILKMRGIDAGYPRLPYIDIDEELKERIKKGLQELGLL